MQKKIFCFIFVAFLSFLFCGITPSIAAADDTILFGPVELKEPINFASQADLEITVQTQNPDVTYTFNSKSNGGCTIFRGPWTPGPCIGEQKLAADPTGNTHIEIISATRIFKGVVDDSARLVLEKPPQAVWDLKAGDKTDWVTYQWKTIIGTPTIEVPSSVITPAEKITVTVKLTAPLASDYAVVVTPFNKSDSIVYIGIFCNPATKACNILNSNTKKAENVIHDRGSTQLTFDISGNNPWIHEDTAYAVKVTSPLIPTDQTEKNQATFMVKGTTPAAPAPPAGAALQNAAAAPAPPAGAAPAVGQYKIPGLQDIFNCNPINPTKDCSNPIPKVGGSNFATLGDVLSGVLNIIFYLALFLTFYYLVWGAFSYVIARGQKEGLAKARARITWAIVGLIVTLLAFFIAKFVSEAFTPKGGLPF